MKQPIMLTIGTMALLFLGVTLATTDADAAELKVLSANNMRPILTDLTGEFERASGHKLAIVYATVIQARDRIQGGEAVDLTILPRSMADDLAKQNRIANGTIADVARTAVVVLVRAGAPKPDIGSADALKRSLLAAKSIAYPDTALGTLVSMFFPGVLERLGIAEQMKSKTKLVPAGTRVAEVVAKGEAEIGIDQIRPAFPGVELVGSLPPEFQGSFVMSAGVLASSLEKDAATALAKYLSSSAAAAVIKAKGMEPIAR